MGTPPQPERRAGHGPLPVVRNEGDILRLALEVAARSGDPNPELVQHTSGTREAATKTTGSWVPSDQPSYLIAIRGRFTTRRPRPPLSPELAPKHAVNETMSFPVSVLVVDIESGRVTDSGSSYEYPELASVGPVVTDYPSPSADSP
jgi:hypothetical protein